MTGGFDWIEKDRALHRRDLARAYGFARRKKHVPPAPSGKAAAEAPTNREDDP